MRTIRRRKGAFTLIELLVVVGIIVLLAGILLPALYKTYRSANKTRVAADLNSIGIALDAYKSDFGDYPRVPAPGTGFAILGKALVAPFDALPPATLTPPGPPFKAGAVGASAGTFSSQFVALRDTNAAVGGTDWIQFAFSDGADGPGFRIRAQGKVTPAYLPPGKFKQQGVALVDYHGSPIMYFPASPVKINLSQANSLYVSSYGASPLVGGGGIAMFNFDDSAPLAMSLTPENTALRTLVRMQAMMGIRGPGLASGSNANGQLQPGATPVSVPFLLWSAGADGVFGPLEDISSFNGDLSLIGNAVRKCDDVANVPLPQ